MHRCTDRYTHSRVLAVRCTVKHTGKQQSGDTDKYTVMYNQSGTYTGTQSNTLLVRYTDSWVTSQSSIQSVRYTDIRHADRNTQGMQTNTELGTQSVRYTDIRHTDRYSLCPV